MPANWQFSTPEQNKEMVGRLRTQSVAVMANMDLSGNMHKKAHKVRPVDKTLLLPRICCPPSWDHKVS